MKDALIILAVLTGLVIISICVAAVIWLASLRSTLSRGDDMTAYPPAGDVTEVPRGKRP